MSLIVGFIFAVVAFALRGWFVGSIASDAVTAKLGVEYLNWFLPAMGLQFAMVAIGAALRGCGIVKPSVAIQAVTVILNMVLAPFLIFGWVTHYPMGVAGAAIATLVSVGAGVLLLGYILKSATGLEFATHQWAPKLNTWWEVMKIGLPAGGEFVLMSVYLTLVYWIIRGFGASAQAGFGIGSRLLVGDARPQASEHPAHLPQHGIL